MDLSIVMVNWNDRDFLRDCLDSIYKSGISFDFEIFVVDNASSDDSLDMLRNEFPGVNVMVNEENLGFTRANNVALPHCSGRYTMLLNNDTLVYENTIDKLIHFMDTHPEAGGCGPRVLNADGTLQPQCRRGDLTVSAGISYVLGLHRIFPGNRFFGKYLMTWQPDTETHEVEAVSGCAFVIRSELFRDLGYLDSDYFLSGDDIDLSFRIRKAGRKIYYIHDAILTHFKGKSVKRHKKSFNIYHMFRSQWLYYKKNWAPGRFFIANWFAWCAIWGGYVVFMGINLFRMLLDKVSAKDSPE